ncbi:MAG: hypothetical protein ACK2UQ_01075, partial [Anaerolineae bacterium]
EAAEVDEVEEAEAEAEVEVVEAETDEGEPDETPSPEAIDVTEATETVEEAAPVVTESDDEAAEVEAVA